MSDDLRDTIITEIVSLTHREVQRADWKTASDGFQIGFICYSLASATPQLDWVPHHAIRSGLVVMILIWLYAVFRPTRRRVFGNMSLPDDIANTRKSILNEPAEVLTYRLEKLRFEVRQEKSNEIAASLVFLTILLFVATLALLIPDLSSHIRVSFFLTPK